MKMTLDERIVSTACQSRRATSGCFVLLLLVVLVPLLIAGFCVFRSSPSGFVRDQGDVAGIVASFVYLFIALSFLSVVIVISSPLIFRDATLRRRIKTLFKKTQTVELEVSYSLEGVEVTGSTYTTRYKWKDFIAWCERDGVVFLFRREKFVGRWQGDCPIVDLNQVAEQELSAFLVLLITKVRKVT